MNNKLANLVKRYQKSKKNTQGFVSRNHHLERTVHQQSLALPQKQRLKMIEELSMAKRLHKDYGLISINNYQQILNRKKIQISQAVSEQKNNKNKK